MSSRYSRPHTPPGPPPSQGSRKSSGRKVSSSSVSSKAPPSRSYDDHHSYDKTYSKPASTSTYPSSKAYSDDKYKSSSVHKVGSEKVPNNSSSGGTKYPPKSDAYISSGGTKYPPKSDAYSSSAGTKYPPKSDAYSSSGGTKFPTKSDAYSSSGGTKYPPKSDAYSSSGGTKYPPKSDDYSSSGGTKYPPKSDAYSSSGGTKYPPKSDAYSSSGGTKYPPKSDAYSSEGSREYKATREVHYPSGDRYSNKDPHLHPHPYLGSYPGEKPRYSDKYLAGSSPPPTYGDTKYAGKKYADDYDPYPTEKSSARYSTSSSLRHDGGAGAYYSSGSLAPYSPFGSYSAYGAYGSTYGGRGGAGSYGASDKLRYESDKLTPSGYSSLDKLNQVPLHPRDKLSSGGYSDAKLGPRSRLYPEDSRRPYRDYTPPPACSSSRSPMRGVSNTAYGTYGHYSPPPRSPHQQYLNRYVIGDSVVYGPPGHYPRDLSSSSPRIRPPSPPSPQPLIPRNFSRYPASPRRKHQPLVFWSQLICFDLVRIKWWKEESTRFFLPVPLAFPSRQESCFTPPPPVTTSKATALSSQPPAQICVPRKP
ncbi:hypothetical protein GWK47_021002 [Chionoecetes opilio]|uniref:Uncharacterized protein n=1 Tax=Chionoecetes opilio TaxID=41210 RepID=A0A8J4XTA8_CHIOP|nr:hypothetical protein GWK47_021002 [Chionoecetes opilio]